MVLLRITPSVLLAGWLAGWLLSALNNGLSGWTGDSNAAGRFPQIGGIRLAFDPTAADKYGRLIDAVLSDVPGTPSLKTYQGDLLLLTTNFVANGGDNYTALAGVPLLLDTSVGDAQVVADFIRANSPVNITKDGRIANCATDASPLAQPEEQASSDFLGRSPSQARLLTPWLSIDLGATIEVQRVVLIPTAARFGAPATTAAHTFTVRLSDVKPVVSASRPDSGIDRSPAALCSAGAGPLTPAGASVVCGRTTAGRFVPAPEKGRYVTVELKSRVARATSSLALAEVAIVACREWPFSSS
ncbi:hypothetical protein ABPG75_003099 [Micractinium tetrahymenae]